ncbi:hypothetical protein LIER_34415 [Lithospermum erythrorhizon]|uniref:Uncharacterized protein n=1 Tax=Lithospermum erythrorhizon TaxID=34254 RepID=A0AAV3S369_LITER
MKDTQSFNQALLENRLGNSSSSPIVLFPRRLRAVQEEFKGITVSDFKGITVQEEFKGITVSDFIDSDIGV